MKKILTVMATLAIGVPVITGVVACKTNNSDNSIPWTDIEPFPNLEIKNPIVDLRFNLNDMKTLPILKPEVESEAIQQIINKFNLDDLEIGASFVKENLHFTFRTIDNDSYLIVKAIDNGIFKGSATFSTQKII